MLQEIKDTLWHPVIAFGAAAWYGFPARGMTVIGVTGTKGKSTTCEMLYAVLTAAGHQTALASTIRFVYPGHEERNMFKMTMPGRGYIQSFLANAKKAGATHAVIEITSEAVLQSRHRYLFLNGLIVTNIQKEHIERHGSFENYVAAKRAIVEALIRSPKKDKVLVANSTNEHTKKFLSYASVLQNTGIEEGAPGDFNRTNARMAIAMAEALGVAKDEAEKAVTAMPQVRGRVEPVEAGQDFKVIVDYAHTPDSLKALYAAFPDKKICVLGNTGGGRDTWKRPLMGKIADEACDTVILTNEDPYDEDPGAIVQAMIEGMKRRPEIIMDRRAAIAAALTRAQPGDTVLISGKGTDPYIMEAHSKKTLWDDSTVVREELAKLGYSKGV